MAYTRGDRNSTYDSPSMVRRDDTTRDRHPSGSSSRHTLTSTRVQSFNRSDSNDPEQMTLSLVNDFKAFVRNQKQDSKPISQSEIELEVADIRHHANPAECDINKLKRKLRSNLRNCPKNILQQSMAYGDNIDEIESIIESKMDGADGDDEIPTDTSIENLIDPLKMLKRDLDKTKSPPLFKDVRKFGDNQMDRAARLFLSEANHITGGLKDYTYKHAETAVKAIRESDCEKDDQDTILAIIKTCRDDEDIRNYLDNKLPKKSTRDRSETPDDQHRTPITSRKNLANPPKPAADDNDTSTFYVKPVHDPDARQSAGDVLQRFNTRTDDGRSRSPPHARPHRN